LKINKFFTKLNIVKIVTVIDKIIDHKFFRPIVSAIIGLFLLFTIFLHIRLYIQDYKESRYKEQISKPIKININNKVTSSLGDLHFAEFKIQSGDTLLNVLGDINAADNEIFNILSSLKGIFDPKLIKVGDLIKVVYKSDILYDQDSVDSEMIRKTTMIESVEISQNLEETIIVSRNSDGLYDAKIEKIELVKDVSKYVGTIKSGLFVDGVSLGASANAVMNMINLYSYDVDFQRDIRSGDEFEILVESYYSKEGKKIKDGNILYSSLTLSGRKFAMYMFESGKNVEYFDEDGNSVKKSLLKTPVPGARVSSRYGMRRHPVLGYSKMHKGVDFAAPRGTPILAAGSGKITYRGRRGGYGNYVRIKHNSRYSTAYAHASRFNRKFRLGSRVKQGDVIAYVGTTGRSTGPHLHFEVLYNGRQINPKKVKATSGKKLYGSKLKKFMANKEKIDTLRKNIPNQSQENNENS